MVEQPWMKIFIGDWIRDTRRLSMPARGAYADLKMQLWISDIRGVITGTLTDVSLLIGISYNETEVLLDEISAKKVFTITKLPNNCYNIIDDAMIVQAKREALKSKAGKAGMKKRYAKNKNEHEQPVITTDTSTVITTDITYNGIDIGNGNDNRNEEIGGAGEREARVLGMRLNAASILNIEDCLIAYMKHPICSRQREQVCITRHFNPTAEGELQRLHDWGEAFNQVLINKMIEQRSLYDWASHFINWLGTQDLTTDPKKIFDAKRKSTAAAGKSGGYTNGALTGGKIPTGGNFD